ncbi:MAG: DUF4886 domain-containing protein [Clostridia bacterium]|nr:DUF4886 domain-containing protein [Clostridia bacterium]
MKVLAIGNSFSQDAFFYLHKIAEGAGMDLTCLGLYIGGCPLSRHAENIKTGADAYLYQKNGDESDFRSISVADALAECDWDVVSLQQVSHDSGLYETYLPYLDEVADFVRAKCPGAKLVIHQTWAYEIDSQHGGFANYDRDQGKMYNCLVAAYDKAAERLNATIIPVGTVIQTLRTTPAFDYANGGLSLCRDGFHLSIPQGRYAAGLTWFATLTGKSALTSAFVPEGVSEEQADWIKKTVDSVVFGA